MEVYSIQHISFYLLIAFSFAAIEENKNTCKTPNNLPGECKDILLCPELLSILKHRPVNSTNADFLLKSKCGAPGESRKVCCQIQYQFIAQSLTLRDNNENEAEAYETAKPASSSLLPDHETCGINVPNKIYGGTKTDIREFPWLVLVENYNSTAKKVCLQCGGVLINSRYVLTAAHCFKGSTLPRSFNITTVRLGEYNTDTDPDCVDEIEGCAPRVRIVSVEEKHIHELYNSYNLNRYHDIALLRLAEEVNYTAYIQPICLPNTAFDHSKNFTGSKLIVAGWGKTENSSETRSPEKMKVTIPVRENIVCTKAYQDINVQLKESQVCAGGIKGKDSCKGDSGGPLMDVYADENGNINWYAIGLVSFGHKACGEDKYPAVYTKVANYVPWIVSKLRS